MEILDKSRYEEFEAFAVSHRRGYFMQSLAWAKLKAGWGHEVVVSRDENGAIRGAVMILIKTFPGGFSLLYAPRGPVFDYEDRETLSDLLEGIKAVGKKHRAFSFKCDPCVLETDEKTISLFRSLGFAYEAGRKENQTVQRRFNYGLNIEGKTEEEVMMIFSQKTRYNIRVAVKHEVECRICGKESLDDFVKLMKVTADRDNFVPRPKSYYEKMLDYYGEDHMRLYLCYYQNEPVSGAMCCQYAGKTYYIFGASSNEHRNVMPNYLMQWEMIKWAVEGGCFLYDFLGIPVNADPDSPTYGVYRFKRGFNGDILGYAGEFDFVLNPTMNALFTGAQKAKRLVDATGLKIKRAKNKLLKRV